MLAHRSDEIFFVFQKLDKMQGTVKCYKCQRVALASTMHYEAENMVVTLRHPNCKDLKQRRRLQTFVVMSGVHYCNICYPIYQSVTVAYQTSRTLYLKAGTPRANQFIDKHIDIFNQASITSGLVDENGKPILLFGPIRDLFKNGAKRSFDAMNIYQTLKLLPPPPPSNPPTMRSGNNHNKPRSVRSRSSNTNNSQSSKSSKRGTHWTRKEVRELIRWMSVNTPNDVKSLDVYYIDKGFVAHMASLKYPQRTEKAYARLYVTL